MKINALWDTFCPLFNPTMHQICDILLLFISGDKLTILASSLSVCITKVALSVCIT